MYNTQFNQGYYQQPNWGAQPRPQAKFTQVLTKEQISRLRGNINAFDWKVSQEELLQAVCTHKENGNFTLSHFKKPMTNEKGEIIVDEHNNPIMEDWARCSICGKEFKIVSDMSDGEVQQSVDNIVNLMQTIKTIYLDAPDSLISNFFQILPVLEKLPRLWRMASNNFNMYDNGAQTTPVASYPGMNGFRAVDNMLSGIPTMQYYQQPAYGYGYQQPVQPAYGYQQPQAPQYGYGYPQQVPMQQPMYQGVGQMYTNDPNNNAFAYTPQQPQQVPVNQAPPVGVNPQQVQQVPVQTVMTQAPDGTQEIQQTKTFAV